MSMNCILADLEKGCAGFVYKSCMIELRQQFFLIVKRIMPGDNMGTTILVLREL